MPDTAGGGTAVRSSHKGGADVLDSISDMEVRTLTTNSGGAPAAPVDELSCESPSLLNEISQLRLGGESSPLLAGEDPATSATMQTPSPIKNLLRDSRAAGTEIWQRNHDVWSGWSGAGPWGPQPSALNNPANNPLNQQQHERLAIQERHMYQLQKQQEQLHKQLVHLMQQQQMSMHDHGGMPSGSQGLSTYGMNESGTHESLARQQENLHRQLLAQQQELQQAQEVYQQAHRPPAQHSVDSVSGAGFMGPARLEPRIPAQHNEQLLGSSGPPPDSAGGYGVWGGTPSSSMFGTSPFASSDFSLFGQAVDQSGATDNSQQARRRSDTDDYGDAGKLWMEPNSFPGGRFGAGQPGTGPADKVYAGPTGSYDAGSGSFGGVGYMSDDRAKSRLVNVAPATSVQMGQAGYDAPIYMGGGQGSGLSGYIPPSYPARGGDLTTTAPQHHTNKAPVTSQQQGSYQAALNVPNMVKNSSLAPPANAPTSNTSSNSMNQGTTGSYAARVAQKGSAPAPQTASSGASAGFVPIELQGQPAAGHPGQGVGMTGSSVRVVGEGKMDLLPGGDRRPDLVESPATRMKVKDFFKQFRIKEKESFEVAEGYATQCLKLLPQKIHWKIYLEIADLARRENRFQEARQLYKKVNRLQPYANQGWLDFAKMEEECGRLQRCQKIILRGLLYCPYDEQLMIKGIKHEERVANLPGARALLARLTSVSIDKAWRTILEGASLEARAGNVFVARRIFKYLMKHVPWYGPIYQEAYRFEERCESDSRARAIVKKGLEEIPRYGPLWFCALRLYERTAKENGLGVVRDVINKAMKNISKELIWKVYFEASQIEGRANNLNLSRKDYVAGVLHCPPNLRWKVWLGGARTELSCGNLAIARKLLDRALLEVPKKMRVMVLLEVSRLEEYAGNLSEARSILQRARKETKRGWKVFLESVLLEMRANNIPAAIEEATEALKIHSGTGRLWAVLIQLKQLEGEREQLKVFQTALKEVPKSGEVWCEGARIMMNPLSPSFDLTEARRFLEFAIQFTPQYGDSFIEYVRLELLTKGPGCENRKLEQVCVNADPNYGTLWFHCKTHPLDTTRQVLRVARELLMKDLHEHRRLYQQAIIRAELGCGGTFVPSSQYPPDDFSTGLTSLNRIHRDVSKLSAEERRKIIFGTDQIIP